MKIFKATGCYSANGNTLIELRIRKNMTLKDLSVKTGLSPSFLSDLEHNRRTCTYEAAMQIEKALK